VSTGSFVQSIPLLDHCLLHLTMVNLYFQPDAQLTTPDRMVLDILKKDYEHQQKQPATSSPEASDDSDDSTVKRTRYAPTPEGMPGPPPFSQHPASLPLVLVPLE
jgi:hypothetical protein